MSDPYISQITLLPFDWPPKKYSNCDGTILTIIQNPTLYTLLGTTFGGDGRNTFALPDLRGRAALHPDDGANINIGLSRGEEYVTLTANEMPYHTHTFYGLEEDGAKRLATGNLLAKPKNSDGSYFELYKQVSSSNEMVTMAPGTCSIIGQGQEHDNMQPSIVINFCIAVEGLYPPRN